MLLSWSLTMSTLQNSMFISQTLFFDLSASFIMVNHFLLFETFFTWLLGPYALLGSYLFHQPNLSFSFAEFLHLFVLSTLECLRDLLWTTFWTLCLFNILVASFIFIILHILHAYYSQILISSLYLFLQTLALYIHLSTQHLYLHI